MENPAPPKRTRAAGYLMLLGALSLAVNTAIGRDAPGDDIRSLLDFTAQHAAARTTSSLLLQLIALLLLPGVVALQGLVRGRGSGLAVTGAVVFGGGLVGLFPSASPRARLCP